MGDNKSFHEKIEEIRKLNSIKSDKIFWIKVPDRFYEAIKNKYEKNEDATKNSTDRL